MEPEGIPATFSHEPPGPDVLLRTVVPPYRLGEMLLQIAELRLDGRLALVTDMGRRTIYFHSGLPVFSESSLFGERLGALGVRHGLLARHDVARALSYARDRGCGIGQALLENERIDSAGLFALLGVQLREVVAASCGGEPLRARFQAGRAGPDGVVILKLHPLTAVLNTLTLMPDEEQDRLLSAVGGRPVLGTPIPATAREWLTDLGYLGELDRLTLGTPTVSGMRSRLLARHRPGAEKCFDPDAVPYSLPGPRAAARPSAPKVADLATLTLLMTGALKLGEPLQRTGSGLERDAPASANGASNPQISLASAAASPLAEIRPGPNGAPPSEVDRMIEAYLFAERDRALAAAAAVWGPSVEASDASVPVELMRLYLTLKPEKRPAVVLGVEASAPPEQILQAYARRAALLATIDRPNAGPHLRCRAAELARCFELALEKLVPGASAGALSPEAGAADSTPPAPASVPPPARSQSQPPPAAAARGSAEASAAKVEALMRAGNWRGVLDTIEGPDASLPFTLRLARAMAQRELQGQTKPRPTRTLFKVALGFTLGLALGVIAEHFWAAGRLLQLPGF